MRTLLQVGFREPQPLAQIREETSRLPGVSMLLAPEQGQFMALLACLLGVQLYLEIGTYTGYSALAIALALPANGKVISCEIDAANAGRTPLYQALDQVKESDGKHGRDQRGCGHLEVEYRIGRQQH